MLIFESDTGRVKVYDGSAWRDVSVDAAYTAYTPTFYNITGGAGSFAYQVLGKTCNIRGRFTAGTATAGGTCGFSLPPGVTWVGTIQSCICQNFTGAWTVVPGTVRSVFASPAVECNKASGANFAAADPLANYTFNVTIDVA